MKIFLVKKEKKKKQRYPDNTNHRDSIALERKCTYTAIPINFTIISIKQKSKKVPKLRLTRMSPILTCRPISSNHLVGSVTSRRTIILFKILSRVITIYLNLLSLFFHNDKTMNFTSQVCIIFIDVSVTLSPYPLNTDPKNKQKKHM